MKMHRHGDVLIVPLTDDAVAALGELPQPHAGGREVLALGEATGHAHVLTGDVIAWEAGSQRYVRVGRPATLDHEEHGVQVIAPGVYEVVIQREWTLEGEWARVAD